ncbi:MAG: DNRLRE domain-containing protein [Planctomycetota bacterium]
MHMLSPGLALAAIAALALPALAQGTTVILPADADSTLYEDATGGLANGGGGHIFAGLTGGAGRRRALVRFDVAAAVPAGAHIVAVELRLNVNRTIFASPLPMDVHRVITQWNEGTTAAFGQEGAGGPAAAGDVTWIHTNFPSALWNRAGGDINPQKSATGVTPINGPAIWSSTTALVADVQGWLDNPATNFGWMVKSDEQVSLAARRFDSRTSLVAANRPALEILYTLPGQWASVGAGCGTSSASLVVAGVPATASSFSLILLGTTPGALAANFYSLALAQPGLDLASGCVLQLDPFVTTTPGFGVLDGGGQRVDILSVPASPVFVGVEVAAQGAIAEPSPLGFGLSNAILAVIQ